MAALNAAQLNFYREHGYLLLERVLGDALLAELRRVIVGYLDDARGVARSNSIYDLDPAHTAERPLVRRLKNPHRLDPVFWKLASGEAIVEPVAQLLGGTVRFDHSKLNFKYPGAHAEIHWHQDWAFYPYTNDDLLAVGVLIEDCSAADGPLMVIPGSHRGPVYDHHHDGVFAGAAHRDDIAHLLDSAVELTAPAGSLTLHHVRTLHASADSRGGSIRPLLLFGYAAVDAFPIFDSYDLAEFDARILRGEPVRAGRMEALPFRIHLPQRAGTDSIYENQEGMKR